MALLIILAVVVVGDFTDINSAQYYGKTKQAKAYAAVDANFELVKAQTVATATLDPTEYTPDYTGQMLIETGSNIVYAAAGTTSNDWALITN